MHDDSKAKDFRLEELEKPLTEQEMKETTGGRLGQGSHLVLGSTTVDPGQLGTISPDSKRGFIETSVNNGGSQSTKRVGD